MKYICKLCKYNWDSRVEKPAQCPRCKRYDWDKDTLNTSRGGGSLSKDKEEKKCK